MIIIVNSYRGGLYARYCLGHFKLLTPLISLGWVFKDKWQLVRKKSGSAATVRNS